MSAELVIDNSDPTPPYEQLRRQLAELIELGVLAPSERLPPLRQLAGDLGLAVGTVARAYAELEASGYLISRRGAGTRVAVRELTRPKAALLAELATRYVARTRSAGWSDSEIREAVSAALRAGHDGPAGID